MSIIFYYILEDRELCKFYTSRSEAVKFARELISNHKIKNALVSVDNAKFNLKSQCGYEYFGIKSTTNH